MSNKVHDQVEGAQDLDAEAAPATARDGKSYMSQELIEISKRKAQTATNPVKLTFHDLRYEVTLTAALKKNQGKDQAAADGAIKDQNAKEKTLKIVKGVSGYAMPGQTLFIMGASGAGKTSLLNILSDRITPKDGDVLSGERLINDKLKVDDNNFGKISGYVMQDDILFAYFTPREALQFAANMKLAHISQQERDERINSLINDLGLKNSQNTQIGSVMRKTISGGERKRTAIGVELITNPSLILLDEPTSGLDSFKALQIVQLLKRLARQGKTIISTIHQPSSEAFLEFDRLLLMSDGYCVFQGDAKQSARYFRDIGFKLPAFSNPADTYMRILAVNYPKTAKDERKLVYFNKEYDKRIRQQVYIEQIQLTLEKPDLDSMSSHSASLWEEFKILRWRCNTAVKRDPLQSKAKIFQQIIFSLLIVCIFWKIGFLNGDDIKTKVDFSSTKFIQQTQLFYAGQQIIGGVFFMSINMFMGNMMNAILVFQGERPVFLREQSNKMYNVGPYFLAKTLADAPLLFFTPLLSTLITYFGINLHRSWDSILFFYLGLVNIAFCASSIGYLLSSAFESETTATGLAPVFIMPMMLFGGLLANNARIPEWLNWLQYCSVIKYGAEALVSNELAYDTHGLRENLLPFLDYTLGYRNCMFILLGITILCRFVAFFMFKSLVRKFQ